MNAIRILLVGMPRILRDLVKEILAEEPATQVISEIDEESLDLHQGPIEADLIILGLHDSELSDVGVQLLTAHPCTRLLGISSDGRRGFLYELRPHAIPLGELSPRGLVEAILRQMRPTSREE